MSELLNAQRSRADLRWQLLTTVSSLALLATLCVMQKADAEDADRPTVWIELGADLDRVNDGQAAFAPPFVLNNPGSAAFNPISPAEAQRPPSVSFGDEGKISFQPEDSNWVFSASVRYGRANSSRHVHQEVKNEPVYLHLVYHGPRFPTEPLYAPTNYTPQEKNFLDATDRQSESHAVIDFQAGRDFGVGLFNSAGTSVLNAGVRFAQFTTRMQSQLIARPDGAYHEKQFPTPHQPFLFGTFATHHYHQYLATGQSVRSFHGVGPSLSWNASAPFAGDTDNGQLSVDWGVNAALLFGRQKANVQHQTSAQYFASGHSYRKYPAPAGVGYDHPQVNQQRARTVTVPNVGGFAGVTFNFPNVKVSAGYRGDFFFGAMDTGFDTAKRSTIGFYGPFATVSIGLGG